MGMGSLRDGNTSCKWFSYKDRGYGSGLGIASLPTGGQSSAD